MPLHVFSASELPQRPDDLRDAIIVGDSWQVVEHLPSQCAQCIITSPPYFGHRVYTKTNTSLKHLEFGQQETPELYVETLTQLFSGLWRLLKPNGTLWLNLGDTYRQNQLLGIPWRVALSLQQHGWLLRSEIIWDKPNAMPSSVKNRPTTSHETIFLFSKSMDYFYEADAIREPHVTFSEGSKMRGGRGHFGKRNGTPEQGKNGGNPNLHNGRWDQAFHPLGRNKRTVWNIALGKFREAHFAVFPPQLVQTCLLAGTAEGDTILDPFLGSGTTAVVAKQHNRHYLGIELVPEYAHMAANRLADIEAQPKLF